MKLLSKIFKRNKAQNGNTPIILYINVLLMLILAILKLADVVNISWWIITLPISFYFINVSLYVLIMFFTYLLDKE